MNRRCLITAGMLIGGALVVSVILGASNGIRPDARSGTSAEAGQSVREGPEAAQLNQQFSGWVFGRMFGVSVPGLGPGGTPPPNVFGWN